MLPEVTYLGHRISAEGIQPTTDKVRAIQDAPIPKNTTELKSFLGLVNFYARFLPHLSTVLSPLNRLLKQGVVFRWGTDQNKAFQQVKAMLLSADLLAHFDPSMEVTLSCDASGVGLGAVLAHRLQDGSERPIAYASRTLNKAEQKYSNIEREALAVTFGVKKFHDYLYGRHFILFTDHKPLITLFNEHKAIPSEVSPRIQRWAMLLSAYSYTITYKPGSSMCHADALSRLPLPVTSPETDSPEEFIQLMDHLSSTPVTAADIQKETDNDPVLTRVKQYTLSGWPSELPHKYDAELRVYKRHETELSVEGGCLVLRTRAVIPPACRRAMLEELHSCHPGINKMKGLARSYVWWPSIDQDIENMVRKCAACQEVRHAPEKAPLHPWEWPERPWSRLHLDFAGPFMGHMFLVVVDSHSKWTEVKMMQKITADKTISALREMFATHGLPDTVVSDNGPTFTSCEFKKFVQTNGIRHVLVSPYHPASNGLAERAVQTFKESMKKLSSSLSLQHRLSIFLHTQHVTPHSTTGVPPAELLMKRNLKTRLDLTRPTLTSKVEQAQLKQKNDHDRSVRERHFQVGDSVFSRNFGPGKVWLEATVVEVTGPVSYRVQLENGFVIRRHVDQLRKCQLDTDPHPLKVPDLKVLDSQSLEQSRGVLLPPPLWPLTSMPSQPPASPQRTSAPTLASQPGTPSPRPSSEVCSEQSPDHQGILLPFPSKVSGFQGNAAKQPVPECIQPPQPSPRSEKTRTVPFDRPKRFRKPPDRMDL